VRRFDRLTDPFAAPDLPFAHGPPDTRTRLPTLVAMSTSTALGLSALPLLGLAATSVALAIGMLLQRRGLAGARQAKAREAEARLAAEAQLLRLQALVQPHFVFNTLAALQHGIDRGDPAAGALLRRLTAFLRRATLLLGRPDVPLADELAAVQDYLAILQARLGDRLQVRIDADPACLSRRLPPGLLLTLVELAVNQGIAPSLQGGTVELRARLLADDGLSLEVGEDGVAGVAGAVDPAFDSVSESPALRHARERLQAYSEGAGRLSRVGTSGAGTCARLWLPPPARRR